MQICSWTHGSKGNCFLLAMPFHQHISIFGFYHLISSSHAMLYRKRLLHPNRLLHDNLCVQVRLLAARLTFKRSVLFVFLRLHFVFPIILKHIQWRVLEISIL
jgi:hypothetical protein